MNERDTNPPPHGGMMDVLAAYRARTLTRHPELGAQLARDDDSARAILLQALAEGGYLDDSEIAGVERPPTDADIVDYCSGLADDGVRHRVERAAQSDPVLRAFIDEAHDDGETRAAVVPFPTRRRARKPRLAVALVGLAAAAVIAVLVPLGVLEDHDDGSGNVLLKGDADQMVFVHFSTEDACLPVGLDAPAESPIDESSCVMQLGPGSKLELRYLRSKTSTRGHLAVFFLDSIGDRTVLYPKGARRHWTSAPVDKTAVPDDPKRGCFGGRCLLRSIENLSGPKPGAGRIWAVFSVAEVEGSVLVDTLRGESDAIPEDWFVQRFDVRVE